MIAYSAYKGYKANKEKKAHEGGHAAPDEMHGVSPAAQEHYAPSPQQQQQQQQQQQYAPPQQATASTHHVPEYSHSIQQPTYVS